MANGPRVPEVERLFHQGTLAGVPDGALLERFLGAGDDRAFEALVALHGPLVLGVCRRLLRDPGDVEDAFQATFLVLVRRARSIRCRDRLGPWLYGVAVRVATRARVLRARRCAREVSLGGQEPVAVRAEPVAADLRSVLDQELARLPEKYRMPLVLCHLQGLTHHETALRLGCPVGTVRSRLARGRQRLAERLARRGLAPAAGLVAGWLAAGAKAAAVPASLMASTAEAAARASAGAAVSAASAALITGVIRIMTWNTWGKGAVVGTALGVILAGAVLSARPAAGDPPRESSPRARGVVGNTRGEAVARRPAVRPLDRYVVEPPDTLIVEALEALPGRPISGERLVRPDGTMSLGFYGDVMVAGLTVPEIKEKVVEHLRKYLDDETLGLWQPDPKGTGNKVAVKPRETDRVFVDIAGYNSAFYYVVGDVARAGRFPITGSDTVLDAINLAGGLLPQADPPERRVPDVRVIRPGPKGQRDEVLPVNFKEITAGTDPSTNYQLRPGDRLVVAHGAPRTPAPREGTQADPPADELQRLERRIDRLEEKLDRVLKALGRAAEDRADVTKDD